MAALSFAAGVLMATYLAGWVIHVPAVAAWVSQTVGDHIVEAGAAVKCLPIVLLGLLALSNSATKGGSSAARFVGVGLLLSSVGDALLDLQARDASLFLLGLVAFLAGHISYIIANVQGAISHSAPLACAIATFPAGMLWLLAPSLPSDMVVPVAVYACVIATMAYTSLVRRQTHNWHRAAAGALIFVLSDTVLALDRFLAPLPNAKLVVMLTYYTAQALIAASTQPAAGEEAAPAPVSASARASSKAKKRA
jgi:alkenylglycerophosphocholine/alkenylglycerophosphoethanolamine hydrolase